MGLAATVKQLDRGAAALGVLVFKEAAALPLSGANDDLFRIAGGKILLTSIIGQVTIAVVCAGVANTKIVYTPTTGLATELDLTAAIDLSAGDNGAEDAILTFDGTIGNPLLTDEKEGVDTPSMATPVILQPGVIAVQQAHAAATGSIKWSMQYVALDVGAVVKKA